MLSRKESKVMKVLYKESSGRASILISPIDLVKMLGEESIDLSQIEKIIDELCMDGYFDLVHSDRHGQKVYCISLTFKGKNFMRDQKLLKRNLIFRLTLSIIFAFISFLIGLILKKIF